MPSFSEISPGVHNGDRLGEPRECSGHPDQNPWGKDGDGDNANAGPFGVPWRSEEREELWQLRRSFVRFHAAFIYFTGIDEISLGFHGISPFAIKNITQ